MEKPKIRFGKFNNKWKKNKLDKVVDFFDNQRIPIDSGERKAGPYPYYGASGIIDYVDGYIFNGEYVLLAEDGANIILRSSPIAYLSKGKFWLNNHAHIMKMKSGSNEFLIQLLEKQNYEKYNTGTAQPKLNSDVAKNITLHFPSDEEQFTIGSLFRILDDLLVSYKDNLANYQSLKATMLSKMFPKAGESVPEIRLYGFEGKWEINKLNKYLTVSKKKNTLLKFDKEDVLSVSGEFGIINQIKFQGRSFAGASVEMYSIVDTGNIVYTKSPLKANPYGIIKTNYGIPGIVSTLYAVYVPNENVSPGFVERYFENDLRLNSYLKPLVNKGAKNDMKVSDENALLGAVIFPQLEEQVAISDYFTNLDKFIQSHKDKITQLETLKKKLLQNMFI